MTDNKLFEETKKRLQHIFEFTVPYSGTVDEADDQNAEDPNQEMNDMGNGEQMPDNGMNIPQGNNNNNNAMPQDGGNEVMPDDGGQPVSGPEGFDPQVNDQIEGGDISQEDFNDNMPGEDDDVIDISDLTDSQKETEKDIEKMDNKFGEIMKQLGSFEELIKNNDEKIEDLKAEFEKRNPTQIEKLGMRAAQSYPFNVSPEEYWKNKEATSNYQIGDDGKEQGQYVITKKDVDGDVDWKSIADSLDDDDFMYKQTLQGVLNI